MAIGRMIMPNGEISGLITQKQVKLGTDVAV